jgi:hypothetical protein
MRELTMDEVCMVSGGAKRRRSRPSAFIKTTKPSFSGRGDGGGVAGSERGMNGWDGAGLILGVLGTGMAAAAMLGTAPISGPVLAFGAIAGFASGGAQLATDLTE